MAEPIIEQIADVIRERLLSADLVASVVRPKRINDDAAGDFKLTVTQGSRSINSELSCQGNPPGTAFNQVFNVYGELRPSEDDDTAIDTYRNRFDSAIRAAITGHTNWHTYGGLAINSEVGAAKNISIESGAGVLVELLVQYRHDENDDTAQR